MGLNGKDLKTVPSLTSLHVQVWNYGDDQRQISEGELPELKYNLVLSLTLSTHITSSPGPSLYDSLQLEKITWTLEGAREVLRTLSELTMYFTHTNISFILEKLSHPLCVHCARGLFILHALDMAGHFPNPVFLGLGAGQIGAGVLLSRRGSQCPPAGSRGQRSGFLRALLMVCFPQVFPLCQSFSLLKRVMCCAEFIGSI